VRGTIREYLPCEPLALKKQLRVAEQPQRNRVYLVTAVLPTPRVREDAAREMGQLRADAERERDEILARLTDTAGRLAEVTAAHAAELEQLRTDAARERDELRAALESRAQVLEESRGELRGRAERDLDSARAELAEMRREPRAEDTPGGSRRRRTGQTPQ
jgi:hypothetical protein